MQSGPEGTLSLIQKYLSNRECDNNFCNDNQKKSAEKYQQIVAQTFGNSVGECVGFVYTWFLEDILNPKKRFSKFIQLINKWGLGENLSKEENQLIDQILQKIRYLQAFQMGSQHIKKHFGQLENYSATKYIKKHFGKKPENYLKDFEFKKEERFFEDDASLDKSLMESGLLRQNALEDSSVSSLPATELEYELKQALKNKDHCMLNLSIYSKNEGGHATGIYQEKAGGPILFYDPNTFIETVKNVQDIVKKINETYEDFFDYFDISKISQLSQSPLKTYTLKASWNRIPTYDTLLSLSKKSSQDSHLVNERKDFNFFVNLLNSIDQVGNCFQLKTFSEENPILTCCLENKNKYKEQYKVTYGEKNKTIFVERDDEKFNVIEEIINLLSSDPDTWSSWNKEFIIIPKIGQNE